MCGAAVSLIGFRMTNYRIVMKWVSNASEGIESPHSSCSIATYSMKVPQAFASPLTGSIKVRKYRANIRACAERKREARAVERRSLSNFNLLKFSDTLRQNRVENGMLRRRNVATLQVNIGLTCDLACRHCHVESSPLRKETMPRAVADRLVKLTASAPHIEVVDITGGAPELHTQFRHLVTSFRALGKRIIDRCNLVVLEEDGQEDTAQFLAENEVRVVASLPCYSAENVERQRGDGVFDASIRGLQKLNALGYGRDGTGLVLDLVYNPLGPTLPPPQQKLEEEYKRELRRAFGIEFNNLICIANMPIKRFADDLIREGNMQQYLDLLVNNFNVDTVDNVMCRDMIHVAWDGTLHDCDFNYALAMSLALGRERRADEFMFPENSLTVFDVDSWHQLVDQKIHTAPHCYGCTAGSGSSCGGSLTS